MNQDNRIHGNYTVEFTGRGWAVFTSNWMGYTCITAEPMPGDAGKAKAIETAKRLDAEDTA